MAEKKAAGTGLKKKLGPLPYWGWLLAAGGGFLGYRYLRARSAASSALAASGTTGGTTIPGGSIPGTSGSTTGLAGSFTSLAEWEQAMLTYLTGNGLGAADALNGVTNWLNGNCVSEAVYQQLSAGLTSSSVGLPPGFTNLPTLSVCPSPTQTGTTGGGGAPPPANFALPVLNSNLFAMKVLFGQYAPGDYTQVGVVNHGVYTGAQVGGGAPVYANVFGGFVQGFDTSTLPDGTGIYVPTDLLDYVSGHVPAGVTVPSPGPGDNPIVGPPLAA